MDRALVLAAVMILAGCARMPEISVTLGQHLPCSVGPVVLNKADKLTDQTAREIVALDKTGAVLCGWTPPK